MARSLGTFLRCLQFFVRESSANGVHHLILLRFAKMIEQLGSYVYDFLSSRLPAPDGLATRLVPHLLDPATTYGCLKTFKNCQVRLRHMHPQIDTQPIGLTIRTSPAFSIEEACGPCQLHLTHPLLR